MRSILFSALVLLAAPAALASEIRVTFSEAFQEKLDEDYGQKEGAALTRHIERSLQRAFERAGVDAARVDVVIEDAKPNRPTFEQLGDEPGLSFQSISIGGMDLSAKAFDASGAEIGALDYSWFEDNIEQAGLSTWSDAKRASDRFARKFAKALKN